jgi:predicted XRE-type DNA-binding protein
MEEKVAADISITPSSGNVFADLGLPDANELMIKSTLVIKINTIIEKRHLSQVQAAELLGVAQPKISALQNGKLRGFSLEKLCHMLTRLGRDVDIIVTPRKKAGAGQVRVCA